MRSLREYLRALAALALLAIPGTVAHATGISILDTVQSAQSQYAARRLREAWADPAAAARDQGAEIELRLDPGLGAEAFSLTRTGKRCVVSGGDARGLIYGALDVREQLLQGTPLTRVHAGTHRPALAFRGIKFNTPWDSYRPSSALDQHYATVRDLEFWEAFLDMMAENR
ncbi:MAG TPA: hypothetical protein VFL16_01675, partial [Steroidobacteraceae bacterium]|nr:hypothetical protein [Steroidobacteraceae bacterium]